MSASDCMQPADVSRTCALHESRADAALPADGSFPASACRQAVSSGMNMLMELAAMVCNGCNGL
jgi:hypothetical protein